MKYIFEGTYKNFFDVEIIVDHQIIMKCNEELLFGQLYIVQSKILKPIFEGQYMPTPVGMISKTIIDIIKIIIIRNTLSFTFYPM